jgi:hypothetical protein
MVAYERRSQGKQMVLASFKIFVETQYGDTVWIVGSSPNFGEIPFLYKCRIAGISLGIPSDATELVGSWSTSHGLLLQTSAESYPIWSTCALLEEGTVHEYK